MIFSALYYSTDKIMIEQTRMNKSIKNHRSFVTLKAERIVFCFDNLSISSNRERKKS